MASYRQRIHRGEVYFAAFPHTTGAEICGTHPVVIVQNEIGNYHSGTVIGVVLTSSNKKTNYADSRYSLRTRKPV